jgi:nucleoid-associated protein YejK
MQIKVKTFTHPKGIEVVYTFPCGLKSRQIIETEEERHKLFLELEQAYDALDQAYGLFNEDEE